MNVNRTGTGIGTPRVSWNKGKLIGQKPPLMLKEIWAVLIRLQFAHRVRDLALFSLPIDSKLRGCDLVRLRVCDIVHGERIVSRATVMQRSNFLYGESRSGRFESVALCPWLTTLAGRYIHSEELHDSTRPYCASLLWPSGEEPSLRF